MPNQVLISHAQYLAERPSILNNLSRSRRDDLIVSFQLIDANERRGPGSQIIMNCEVGWHYGTYALSEIQSDNVRFLHRAFLAPQLVEFARKFLSLPTCPPLLNPSNRLAASYRETCHRQNWATTGSFIYWQPAAYCAMPSVSEQSWEK